MSDLSCCGSLDGGVLEPDAAEDLAVVMKALADPIRLRVVSAVASSSTGEVCACDLPTLLDRTQPTISHHLSVLVKAGVLDREQRGKWAWFRLRNERLRSIVDILDVPASGATEPRPGILFLCVHNAGRSQMAAGFTRSLGGDRVRVFSGGSDPGNAVNPVAVEAMHEVGIDISGARPQPWTQEILHQVDVVITMGCGDVCPVLPGKRYVDWPLDDPAGHGIEVVRRVRDQIRRHVEGLLTELDVERA